MMAGLQITNRTRMPIDERPLIRIATQFLSKHGIVDNVELELRLVGKVASRQLNRIYRHKDRPTDVLSFPLWPNLAAIKEQPGPRSIGSVVICLPIARQQAVTANVTLEKQLIFLLEHSLWHLIGVHHEGDE